MPDAAKLKKEIGDRTIARTDSEGFALRDNSCLADQCPHCRGERTVRGHTDACALQKYLEVSE